MTKKVFINGFGRIGRVFLRSLYKRQDNTDIEIVGINDLVEASMSAYLLKYDTTFGPFLYNVEAGEKALILGTKSIPYFSEKDPAAIPYKDLGVDIVLESSGVYRKKKDAEKHIAAGAKKVLVSAPMDDGDITLVYGVNHDKLKPEHKVISNASCTTNCLAPVVKVLHENLSLVKGLMTTCHAVTNDQRVLDVAHKDFARARASCFNIIPTTTGAAKAMGLVMPELKGKLNGISLRVPVITGSIVDLTVEVAKDATKEGINAMMKAAAEGPMKGVLGYTEDVIVSSDVIGNPLSSVFDSNYTDVIGGKLVKVLSWYDNESGYSNRCIDVIDKLL